MSAALPYSAALACPVCGQVHRVKPLPAGMTADCVRCGSRITARTHNSLHRTAAFALAALILYIPANIFPILRLTLYGATSDNTVFDGVRTFYNDDELFMAAIVLLASIVVPVMKLSGLFFLVLSVKFKMHRWRTMRTWLYRFIDLIGKWAMLDVFVLSIWVALVKLNSLGSVSPGPGLLPFGCVVVLTLLASQSFDPQLIWERDAAALPKQTPSKQ